MEFDSLEFIRRLEEEFSIYLPPDELNEVYTVSNLYNLLLRLLRSSPDCLTSKSFYRVRRALVEVLGLSRASIRPGTFLDDLFDQKQVRQQWRNLSKQSDLKMPSLRHTAMWKHWMQVLSAFIAIATTLSCYALLSRFHTIRLGNSESHNILVFGGFAVFGSFVWSLSFPALLKATAFRRSVLPTLTVAELTRVVLSLNEGEFTTDKASTPKLTNDQVWLRLVHVLRDQMGFVPEEIVPSASIMVDLAEV